MDALLLWWCFWSLVAVISAFFGSLGRPRRFVFLLIVFEFMASCIYYALMMQVLVEAWPIR